MMGIVMPYSHDRAWLKDGSQRTASTACSTRVLRFFLLATVLGSSLRRHLPIFSIQLNDPCVCRPRDSHKILLNNQE